MEKVHCANVVLLTIFLQTMVLSLTLHLFRRKIKMEYSIGYVYYKELLNSLKKDKKNPTKRDVIEYLNKTAGIKGGVKKLTIS